jgi:hypothetical protein
MLPARMDRKRQKVIRDLLLPGILEELRALLRVLDVDGEKMAEMMIPASGDQAEHQESFRLRYFVAPLNSLRTALPYTHIFEPELAAALLTVNARMERLIALRAAIVPGTVCEADARDEVRIAWTSLVEATRRVLEVAPKHDRQRDSRYG